MAEAITGGSQLGAQRHIRLAHPQAGEQAGQHHQGKQQVGAGPGPVLIEQGGGAKAFGEIQRAGSSQQGGDPITGHIAGGQGSLTGVVDDFQAIGIDGDVLGGRGECHQHGQGDQPGQVGLRVAQGHAGQADGDQDLRQHQPGAAPTQLAQQRQAPLVEQRRPDPFEGVSKADQAGKTNGVAGHAGFAQPHR